MYVTAVALLGGACVAAAQTQSSDTPQGVTPTPTGEEFTLNFKEAEIKALIATVSELTGRNFVVDPRVKGQVTVLSSHPMTPDELYETFLSVLEVHGFSAVSSGEVTKIVPQVNAKQDGGFDRGRDTREDIVTRVIQIGNVPADQLVPILRPLVPQYGHLAAYPASNILIISDRKANVGRIRRIVNRIDKEGNRSVETIALENANAGEVVQVVKKLKADAKQSAPSGSKFSVIADERTNSVIIAGDPESRLRLRAIIADLDTPVEREGGTKVVYLDYADAESVSEVLQQYADKRSNGSGGGNSSGTAGQKDISVLPAEGANALVINAPASAMREIRQVIDKLDIRRGQVLIEGIVAEVSVDQSRNLGVNVAALDDNTVASASILDQNTLNEVPGLAGDGTPLNLIQQGLNVALGADNNGDGFAALVRAFSGNSRTNVLSTPSIVTRDNEEAEISVGQEVPFLTGSYTTGANQGGSGGSGAGINNPFQTIERKDVGLTLTLTPQINKGETIQMTLEQEISSIAQGAQGATDLITNKRTLNTSVEVENSQILVLGGLIDSQVQESTQKVPILGDIPLLGALFTSQDVNRQKRNLLNFIRPTILRGEGSANYYTRRKYEHMREIQKQAQKSDIPLMPNTDRPELPPMERYRKQPIFPNQNPAESGSAADDDKQESGPQATPAPNPATHNR